MESINRIGKEKKGRGTQSPSVAKSITLSWRKSSKCCDVQLVHDWDDVRAGISYCNAKERSTLVQSNSLNLLDDGIVRMKRHQIVVKLCQHDV